MLFAIVFGLSMDYEVFLVSRMHERWTHTRDSSRAVAEGLALTGRVVTAAAAIMVCVFLSFMLGEDRIIKEFGLSLASAVFLDALVVRCLLLPAVLHLIGERTWPTPGLARPAAAAPEHRGHHAADDTARRGRIGLRRLRAATPGCRPPAPGSRRRGSGGLSHGCRRGLALRSPLVGVRARSRSPQSRSQGVWPARCSAARRGDDPGAARRLRRLVRSDAPASASSRASRGLSVGIMSATPGRLLAEQLLLDITQGARIAASAYPGTRRRCAVADRRPDGHDRRLAAARRRAEDAPQLLRPGLLAGQIPGGGGLCRRSPARRTTSTPSRRPIAGAGSRPSRSGGAPTLLARAAGRCTTPKRLVVADLPGGAAGHADLRALAAGRAPRRAPARRAARRGPRPGANCCGSAPRDSRRRRHELSSQTTDSAG